jgi:hypothetical protein
MNEKPIAILKIDISKHPGAMADIAVWLKKQADYLVAHQTKVSKHFMARMFKDPK